MTIEPFRVESAVAPRRAGLRVLQQEAKAAAAVGQLPAKVDLTIYQGDDIFVNIAVDGSVIPIDLTTYTAKAEIHSAPGGPLIAVFVATIVDSLTVGLHLPHAESTKLVGNAAWDVQIIDPAGVVTTLAYGLVTTVKQVTP